MKLFGAIAAWFQVSLLSWVQFVGSFRLASLAANSLGRRFQTGVGILFAACAVVCDAQQAEYSREVLPLLRTHCYKCHGPDRQDGGLRLDVRAEAFKGGASYGVVIVPGSSQDSRLIEFVRRDDADLQMPPDGERLSAQEISLLSRWIDQGANWPDEFAGVAKSEEPLWSLTPLVKPAVPEIASNPIDAFVRKKLAEHDLDPAPEADRRTLIRRLYYDLIGLPPSPEEVDAFLADADPKAYETIVSRLLDSPRYGEHWARHWLDVANYADTHGNDHDYIRPNAWPYRDYVIKAFNDDKPYARFVQEQVAGDALFPHDPQATVALGFVAAGPWDHTLMVTVREDTVDHRLAQNLDRDEMVSAVFGTFQSLTVHCARCHDHKFDPISQREYYSLQSVFAGVDRSDRPFDDDGKTQAERQRLLAEQRALQSRDPALLANLNSPDVRQKVACWESQLNRQNNAWEPLDVLSIVATGGTTLSPQADGSWFASGIRPERDTYIVTARRAAGKLGAVRLEVLPDDRLPQRGPGRFDNGNFHLTEFRAFAAAVGAKEPATALTFSQAIADYDEGPEISAAQAIDGKNETQWGVHPQYGKPHVAVFMVKDSPEFPEATTFTFLLENQAGAPGHGIGRFRLTTCGEIPNPMLVRPLTEELSAILQTPDDQRTPENRQELALAVLTAENDSALRALPPPRWVYAITKDFAPDGENFKPSPQPRPIRVLTRGDLDKPGELVGPGTLQCVPNMPSRLEILNPDDESARRAALALWLSDERNALTWRSIVNRVWSWHFGQGICDSPNDFGRMGGLPSHPDLLDWLAIWFRDEAQGSIKALQRMIVTSETWKQSTFSTQGTAFDRDNRLLWRQNRPRLSGEEIRDTLLVLSGQLDLTMGGPPAVQFVSRGDATFMAGGNPAFLDYGNFDPDSPANSRRAVYRFLFRTVPDPFIGALDCPDGSSAIPVRSVSTTALQALAMLNDAFLLRQCQHIADRIEKQATTAESQADEVFRLILLRTARDSERARLADYIRQHGLSNACHLLLNTNEFLYLD